MGTEIKQVQEAADAFKDDKIDQVEAKKIAEALDPAKIKATDIQEFINSENYQKNYQEFLDKIMNDIDNYTKVSENELPPLTPNILLQGNNDKEVKRLVIEDNKPPRAPLDKVVILDNAKKFLLLIKQEKANFEKKKNTPGGSNQSKEVIGATTEDKDKDKNKNKKYEAKYIPGQPLESMRENLNTILPVDKKLPEAEIMRTNMRKKIIDIVITSIDEKLKNRGNQGQLKEKINPWLATELTDKRIDNLITGSMYVTLHDISRKINQPNIEKIESFNIAAINIFKDIKDINSLLAKGDRFKNLTVMVEEKLQNRIKETFKKSEFLKSPEKFRELLDRLDNKRGINPNDPNSQSFDANVDNPFTVLFNKDIILETEQDVINLIQGNISLEQPINKELIATPKKIQESLYKNANEIISSIPLDPHEKEAFKTGLIQNKISGWPKEIVAGFLKIFKGTKLFDFFKGMFGGTMDKLFLSKARNDAQEGAKVYEENKKDYIPSEADKKFAETISNQDFKNIINNISSECVYQTLVLSKKYILPENTTTAAHQEKFLSNKEYDINKVVKEFSDYKKDVNDNWGEPIGKRRVDAKGKDVAEGGIEEVYKYSDIIKTEKDLIEHFFNYVQTGEKPGNYKDKTYYEDLNAPWKKVTVTTDIKASDGNVIGKEGAPIAPINNEKIAIDKQREAADKFASSVQGIAEVSQKWTDSYFVRHPKTGIITMFKGPNAKRTGK